MHLLSINLVCFRLLFSYWSYNQPWAREFKLDMSLTIFSQLQNCGRSLAVIFGGFWAISPQQGPVKDMSKWKQNALTRPMLRCIGCLVIRSHLGIQTGRCNPEIFIYFSYTYPFHRVSQPRQPCQMESSFKFIQKQMRQQIRILFSVVWRQYEKCCMYPPPISFWLHAGSAHKKLSTS